MARHYNDFYTEFMFDTEDNFKHISEEQQERWKIVFEGIQNFMEHSQLSHATCSFGEHYYYNITDNTLLTSDEFTCDESLKKSEDDYRTYTEPENIFRVLLDCNVDDYMHSPKYWVDTEQWDDNHKPLLCLYVYYGNPCDNPHSIGPDSLYECFAEFRLQYLNHVNHWNFSHQVIEPLYNKDYHTLCSDIIDNNKDVINEILSETTNIRDISRMLITRLYKEFNFNLCDYLSEMIEEAEKYQTVLGSFDQLFIDNIYEMCLVPYIYAEEDEKDYYKCPVSKEDFRSRIYDEYVQEWIDRAFTDLSYTQRDYMDDVYETLHNVLVEKEIGDVEDHKSYIKDLELFSNWFSKDSDGVVPEISLTEDKDLTEVEEKMRDFSRPVYYRDKPDYADKIFTPMDYFHYKSLEERDNSEEDADDETEMNSHN